MNEENLKLNIQSAYIHIPFCQHICTYCDFPKMLYQEKWISKYLEALKQEILTRYHSESMKTIYIGGGTPSVLDVSQLEQLLKIVNIIKRQDVYEYTIECNVESLTEEKMQLFKQYGINRVSIGVETFHVHHLKKLNRMHTKEQVRKCITLLKQYGIDNINLDFIYALPNETLEEVEEDIQEFLKLKVPHISTYSLIIEPNTTFAWKQQEPITEELDEAMYQMICHTLKEKGYLHYEISNFSLPGYSSKHNLTYWNNNPYYGFGLGASGYIENIRYTNTRSFTHYCEGKYTLEEEVVHSQIAMENEMILGLRKIEGVQESKFKERYGKTIDSVFPIQELIQKGKLIQEEGYIKIPESYLYISNDILVQFIGNQYECNYE